jgi:hypothetical protein
MAIGKKIDKLKRWDLGNDQIEETNVYKYLGVYFSRSLIFTYHIEIFIKEFWAHTVILTEFRLEIYYRPLLYALLLHTVAPYGSIPQFQALKTLKNIESL